MNIVNHTRTSVKQLSSPSAEFAVKIDPVVTKEKTSISIITDHLLLQAPWLDSAARTMHCLRCPIAPVTASQTPLPTRWRGAGRCNVTVVNGGLAVRGRARMGYRWHRYAVWVCRDVPISSLHLWALVRLLHALLPVCPHLACPSFRQCPPSDPSQVANLH